MLNEILMEAEMNMEASIKTMNKRLANIRAGRANPAILSGVMVEYYGAPTPLQQVANISIPEARQLMIKPFDKSCLGAIEKGIFEANIGLTPNNNGDLIILNIPALTEQTRRDYVKQAKTIAEEAKIALRNVRQDANSDIKRCEEGTEDDKKGFTEDVQDLINNFNKKVDELFKAKEDELMSV